MGGILFNASGRAFSPDGQMFMPDSSAPPQITLASTAGSGGRRLMRAGRRIMVGGRRMVTSSPRVPMTAASGDILLDGDGNRWLDPAGRVILDDGTGNCCVVPARKCSDGSLTTLMKPKSAIPSFPYYENVGGVCYYWPGTDSARPLVCGGTLIGSGTAVSGCSDPSCTGGGGSSVVALVTFAGINPCGGGDCGYGPNMPDIQETVMGPTFCLIGSTPLYGDRADWYFCNSGYVKATDVPCGSGNTWASNACVGLQILLEQVQDPSSGIWYFALSTFWDSRCNSDPDGAYFSFFINDGRQNMTAAGITDLRSGSIPVAGDSYAGDNDQPSSNCTTFPIGNGNTWGYGGSATITFAATCPSGAVLSNCPFSLSV